MAYRATDFIPGAVPIACSICGRRRKFPDEIEKSDDGKFRCLDECTERTVLSVDRERAAFRPTPEQVPPALGRPFQGDIPLSFLAKSQQLVAERIPGWTPTTTFHDDFTILPGGVGSSWSVAVTGASTITAPLSGVARFTTSAGSRAHAWVPTVTIPTPTTGRFYCRVRFAIVTNSAVGVVLVGATSTIAGVPPVSGFITMGTNGTATTRYVLRSAGATQTSVFVDLAEFHVAEMWWKGNGYVWGGIDFCPDVSTGRISSLTEPINPYLVAASTGVVMDVTDAVFMV